MHLSPLSVFPPVRRPILRIFGYSVDATLAIVLVHLSLMVFFAVMIAAGFIGTGATSGDLVPSMVFDTKTAGVGMSIQSFLYPFCHDIRTEHLFFAVEMLLLFFCGRSLENQIGRAATILYHAVLILLPPLLLLAISRISPLDFELKNSFYLTVTLCLSYLLLAPHSFQGSINLRFLTWLLIGFCAVFFVANKYWQKLGYLSVTLTVSLLYLEIIGAGRSAGILYLFRSVSPGTVPSDVPIPEDEAVGMSVQESVDELLDKISKKGMGSLSREERQFLDNAGKRLGRKDE